MHILYVDESGAVDNPEVKYFVLAGISVFERGLYHLIKAADDLVASFQIENREDVELHGSPMYSGRDIWRKIGKRDRREKMISDALSLLVAQKAVKLFAVAIELPPATQFDPTERAFEEICNRFNLFLLRQNQSRDELKNNKAHGQRGLIVMDNSKHEQPLQKLARQYRDYGGRWGKFGNLAEVPLFVDSRASRLVQLADLVAYAVWRKYEHKDGRFFDPLIPLFDTDKGIAHGLVHYKSSVEDCFCHACYSRYKFRVGSVQ